MGIQIKNHFGAGPVRILVVSQTYRNLTGLENIGMDVVEIEDLYARKMDSDGEEFRNKFRIEKFFTVQNRDFTDLTNFLSSINFSSFKMIIAFSTIESVNCSFFAFLIKYCRISPSLRSLNLRKK